MGKTWSESTWPALDGSCARHQGRKNEQSITSRRGIISGCSGLSVRVFRMCDRFRNSNRWRGCRGACVSRDVVDCDVSSGVPATRSAAEERGMGGSANCDEGAGGEEAGFLLLAVSVQLGISGAECVRFQRFAKTRVCCGLLDLFQSLCRARVAATDWVINASSTFESTSESFLM